MEKWIIEKIKASANVVDVIADFVSLHKSGANMTGLCPFHADRHLGSFFVSERRNVYTCFSCGAHGDSVEFLMQHEHLSYIDALRWLAAKYSIDTHEGGQGEWRSKVKAATPHTPLPPLPMFTVSLDVVKARLNTTGNTLCEWIRNLPWSPQQEAAVEPTLKAYLVGASKMGHTIYWQIDETGQVRTGKMMLYRSDGHRDKQSRYAFDWIHSSLARAGLVDLDKEEPRPCLFGLHLLPFVSVGATINIVESEKTAILCNIIFSEGEGEDLKSWGRKKQLWLACAGINNLTEERLRPLIQSKRQVVLYPDHDGLQQWEERAKMIGYKNLHVNSSYVTRYWQQGKDQEKADIADILLRLMQEQSARQQQRITTIEQVKERWPVLSPLIEKLNLEIFK